VVPCASQATKLLSHATNHQPTVYLPQSSPRSASAASLVILAIPNHHFVRPSSTTHPSTAASGHRFSLFWSFPFIFFRRVAGRPTLSSAFPSPCFIVTMRAFVAISLAVAVGATPSFRVGTIHNGAAPLIEPSNADHVPNSYIVKFKDHVTEHRASEHHLWVQQVHGEREGERLELRKRGMTPLVDTIFEGIKHTYKVGTGSSFIGYSGHFDDQVIEQVRRHPDVSQALFSSFAFVLWLLQPSCRLLALPAAWPGRERA
jgi:Peptidase inhibitor I9